MIRSADLKFEPGRVYAPNGAGLGDLLASINFSIKLATRFKQPVSLSTWYYRRNHKAKRVFPSKIFECLSVFDGKHTADVLLTDAEPYAQFLYLHSFGWKFASAIETWKRPTSVGRKYICYEFDGKSHKRKNFNKTEEEAILAFVRERRFECIRLGANLVKPKSPAFFGLLR